MNTSHWHKIRQKGNVPSEIRKLRIFLDQYLDTQDFYQKAVDEYKKAHRSEMTEVPAKPEEQRIIPQEPNAGHTFDLPPPPKNEEDEEVQLPDNSKNFENIPKDVILWIKKIYKWVAVRYHPDKTDQGKEWFQDWLSAYSQGDWVLFFVYLENFDELWQKYPPPVTFSPWLMSFIYAFISNEYKIANQKEYQWWLNKQISPENESNE